MTFFTFFGALALSYYAHRFLKRLFPGEYHATDVDGAREFPATATSAAEFVLQEEVNVPPIVSDAALSNSVDVFDECESFSVENITEFLNGYERLPMDKEDVLRRKEEIYLHALNSERLPKVGYLPTIFECPISEARAEEDYLHSSAGSIPSEKKKKKKFRKVRSFFKKFSCISKVED